MDIFVDEVYSLQIRLRKGKMNAYELADYVADNGYIGTDTTHEVANMLRQQADRIAELESCLDFALQDTMDYIRLNNLGGENNHWLTWARKLLVNTTPQTKPLSEKELYEVFDKCYPNNGDGDVVTLVDFARAIEERHGIK